MTINRYVSITIGGVVGEQQQANGVIVAFMCASRTNVSNTNHILNVRMTD